MKENSTDHDNQGLKITQARKHAKGIHPDFETQNRSPKQGYQWPPRKGLVSSKNLKKKKKSYNYVGLIVSTRDG